MTTLTYTLLKTSFNPFSETFADMVAMFNLGEDIVEEGYAREADHLRLLGCQNVPTLIATAVVGGRLRLVHECFNPAELPSFVLQAATKLEALEAELEG